MALKMQTQTTPSNVAGFEKAAAFINISLPGEKAGTHRKLGAIPLKLSNVNETRLMEWLKADPANVAKLVSKLIVDFKMVETEGTGFDLS